MMHRFPALLLFIVILTIGATSALAEDRIEILSPPDMASVGGHLINLVYKVENDSFDTVAVTNNYNPAQGLSEGLVKLGIHHDSLSLSDGENRISIQLRKDRKVIAEKAVTVFVRSNLVEEYITPPSRFKNYLFHTRFNERRCSICHAEELLQGAKSRQNGALPACYTCHKRTVDHQHVHGPTSVWACSTCHNINSEDIKNQVPEPEVKVCQICHTEELATWRSEKFGHGPTMAGKCAFCHNPHGSIEKFFLNRSTSDLCGYCHRDKLEKPHLVADFFKQGHPVKLVGARNGTLDITCASCHNPHAANNVNLLKWFEDSNTDLCRHCHFI